LAATLIGEERSHQMWKSVLTTQPSRIAVLAGKVAVAMLFLGALMGGALVSGALFGAFGTLFLPTTFEGDWGGLANLFLLQWSFSAALVAFALLMMHLARNLAVGVILVFFLPALLEGLYTVYATVVGFQPINRFNVFLQTIRMRQLLEDLPAYFFGGNVFAPARAPMRELVAEITGGATSGPDLGTLIGTGITIERAAWVVAGYTALLLALLAWRFLRSDVD
jgi:ABC-type transport system involved in multi-copper enzyme maturation permease subunit